MLVFPLLVIHPAMSHASESPNAFTFVEVEELEYRARGGNDVVSWEAQGWVGGDYDKLWIKTRGEHVMNRDVEHAEIQALYSRALSAFWDLQVGVRYDRHPDPARGHAVLGVQGLAPYFIEADAAAFLSDEGHMTARVEAEHELLVTQRLAATSVAELDFAVQDLEELAIRSGLSHLELGLRVRYEIVREVAPYVGLSWERKMGATADLARRRGQDVDDVALVTGVRVWF